MRRRGLTLALLAATAALAPAALPAQTYAGKWIDAPSTAPLDEPAGIGSTPVVAMNASGAEIIAWYEGQTILVRVRQPGGGAFGAPLTLGPPPAGGSIGAPSVAIDAAGDTLVVWSEYDGAGHYSVRQASAGPGQPLGAGTTIQGSVSGAPKAGVLPLFLSDGTAMVFWSSFEGSLEFVRRAAGGEFGSPVTLEPSEVVGFTAVPESGARVLVGWTDTNAVTVGMETTTTYTLKSADVSAAGASSGRQTLDTRSSIYTPSCTEIFVSCTSISLGGVRAAADPAGDGLISYQEVSQSSNFLLFSSIVVKASYRTAGGGFEAPVGFPAVTTSLGGIGQDAGLLADGSALVAWDEGQFGAGVVRYAQRSRSGAFPATGQVLAPGSASSGPRIEAGGEGALLVDLHGKEVLAQEFTAGGPQGSSVALSANDTSVLSPTLAGDGSGDAMAAWERANPSNLYMVEAASYDVGPRIAGLGAPASGVAGVALPFTVSAVDPLSPVSAQWTFGDGAKAAGTSVTHAYAAAGAQTVSVLATDAAGLVSNTLSAVTQVGVAPVSPISTPLPGPRPSSGATLKVLKQRLRDVLRKGLALSVGCSGPCTLELTLQVPAGTAKALGLAAQAARAKTKPTRRLKRKAVTVGRLKVTLKAAGTKTVHVPFTKTATHRLRHVHKLTLNVIDAPVHGTAGTQTLTQSLTLR